MAKSAPPNTAGSGFYLTFEPTPWLNGAHTVFGRVLEGLDIIRQIRQDDDLLEVNILRKRDHEYTVKKLPLPGQSLSDDESASAEDAEAESEPADGDGDDDDDSPPTTPDDAEPTSEEAVRN